MRSGKKLALSIEERIQIFIRSSPTSIASLFIDPCIPKHWKSFSIKRVFRGKTYRIEVLNPKGVNKGVVRVEVNGEVVKGSLVTHQKSSNIDVKVLLG